MTPEPMTSLSSLELLAAYPEIVMAVGSMILLMAGVFIKGNTTRMISIGAIALMLIAAIVVLLLPEGRIAAFNNMFVTDAFGRFAKILILIGGVAAIVMSMDFIRREKMERFEFPVLITIAVLGMMMMVSSNSLISLYLGLELQSLALYVIAAFNRDSARSSEAGLKYFLFVPNLHRTCFQLHLYKIISINNTPDVLRFMVKHARGRLAFGKSN